MSTRHKPDLNRACQPTPQNRGSCSPYCYSLQLLQRCVLLWNVYRRAQSIHLGHAPCAGRYSHLHDALWLFACTHRWTAQVHTSNTHVPQHSREFCVSWLIQIVPRDRATLHGRDRSTARTQIAGTVLLTHDTFSCDTLDGNAISRLLTQ